MIWTFLLRYWRQFAAVLIVFSILLGVYFKGRSDEKAKWVARQNEIALQNANLAQQQAKETIKVVTKYINKVKYIKDNNNAIINEVFNAVTSKDDATCTVNNGFVRMWNDANKGKISEATRNSDAATSAIILSDIATQHVKEAGICRETEEQLISLQEWIKSVCETYGCE